MFVHFIRPSSWLFLLFDQGIDTVSAFFFRSDRTASVLDVSFQKDDASAEVQLCSSES